MPGRPLASPIAEAGGAVKETRTANGRSTAAPPTKPTHETTAKPNAVAGRARAAYAPRGMGGRARIVAGTGLLAALALALALAPAARAETGLVVDPAWPGAPFGHDFAFGDQGPRAMAADDHRIWVLGNRASATAQGGVLTALQPGGARDTGFSGDGELPVDIGPSDGGAYGWDVVALPNGDAAVLSSRVGTGESDLAIEVVRPDGSPDPAFAGDGVAVVAGPGVETPMRLAYDPSTQRFLVTGDSFAAQGAVPDTFVAAITWGGAPDAGFGTGGFRVFDGGGIDHADFGDAIVPLGDGRVAVWYRWNAGGEIDNPDPRTALRVLTSAGADDAGFSGDGDLPTPAMTYGRDLAVVDGTLVGVGSRSVVGVSSESMVMRVGLDGGGLTQTPVDLVPGVDGEPRPAGHRAGGAARLGAAAAEDREPDPALGDRGAALAHDPSAARARADGRPEREGRLRGRRGGAGRAPTGCC